jgi:PI31 proteasome regulator N-terminal
MTPEELEAAKRDAEKLRAAVSGLEAGLAKQHMEASLASLERIISKAESGEGPYTLQIVCPGRTFTVHLPATATVGQLREAVLRESGVAHTHSALTAAGVGDLNEAPADKPLASSQLPREAELTLSLKQAPAVVNARAGVTATSAAAALAQARRAGVSAGSSFESLALALHCFMLQSGFVCTGTDEGAAVSGFAPPVRDVPEGQVVPKDWNSVAGAIRYCDTPFPNINFMRDIMCSTCSHSGC